MNSSNHWLIRIRDGKNFRNSNFPLWGVKRGPHGCIKSLIKNRMNPGDILWFMTSKKFGGQLIGMAEYIASYDRADESLISINTKSNIEQNWDGDEAWDIQLHYTNLYNTEKQNIAVCIACPAVILKYNTFKEKINDDLHKHFENFKKYAVPITNIYKK